MGGLGGGGWLGCGTPRGKWGLGALRVLAPTSCLRSPLTSPATPPVPVSPPPTQAGCEAPFPLFSPSPPTATHQLLAHDAGDAALLEDLAGHVEGEVARVYHAWRGWRGVLGVAFEVARGRGGG